MVGDWALTHPADAPDHCRRARRARSGLLAPILLTILLAPAPAWSLAPLRFVTGRAAETDIGGNITGNPNVGGCPANVSYGQPLNPNRQRGGEGVASAQDTNAITSGGASQSSAASADAVHGTLRGVVSADLVGSCASGGAPLSDAGGAALTALYDTYTVTSGSLAVGTPVSVSMTWTFNASFSGGGQGDGELFIVMMASPPASPSPPPGPGFLIASQTFNHTQGAGLSTGGTVNISAEFQNITGRPLTIGDSFILSAYLTVQAGAGLGLPPGPAVTADVAASVAVTAATSGATLLSGALTPTVVLGWGENGGSELGDGTTTFTRLTPVQATGLTDVTAIAGGRFRSLALDSTGRIWAWGTSIFGALGDGSTDRAITSSPVRVPGLAGVTAISAGTFHNLALDSSGQVWAWGWNASGQLGTPTGNCSPITDPSVPCSATPVLVSNLPSGIVAVAAGFGHSLALDSTGAVWAWGGNGSGQLGDGTEASRSSPARVHDPGDPTGMLTGVVGIAAGGDHSMAFKPNGTVWAWGDDSFRQLGVGGTYTGPRLTPVQVQVLPVGALTGGAIAIVAAENHSLALVLGSLVQSFGVLAWGDNSHGQLGTTTGPCPPRNLPCSPTPLGVSGLPGAGALAIAPGVAEGHSVALDFSAQVWAWGENLAGQLGDGTTTDTSTPARVLGPGGVGVLTNGIAVATGTIHSLAIVVANTPVGANVGIAPRDPSTGATPVTVTFSGVTGPGLTSLSTSAIGPPPPAGFMLGSPSVYFGLSTTAIFSPPVTVCINYGGIAFAGPPQLLHFDPSTQSWVDVTTSVDTANQIICGSVRSFSSFAIFQPTTLPGRMHGQGFVDTTGTRHHFEFQVEKRVNGAVRGSLHYREDAPGSSGGQPNHHPLNRFVSSAISFAGFSSVPTTPPHSRHQPAVNSVAFGGTGRWNGAMGYTFEVTATDVGEPGRGRDVVAITIRAPGGAIVATVKGTLGGGNIQALPLTR